VMMTPRIAQIALRRLFEEVTRKFWPTEPSKPPCTGIQEIAQIQDGDRPPVVRTM